MTPETIAGLSPGIRDLVVWLNAHAFDTCDSGDGSNHAAGMEGAHADPMVAIIVKPHELVPEAHRLYMLLMDAGVRGWGRLDGPSIEATYNPHDGMALLLLTGVASLDVPVCRTPALP